jgi:very-short-patch-repair endonuclease
LWKKHDEYNLELFSRKVKSQYEEEIAAWLSDNSIDFKRNVKIETKTVDFLIQNIAIEFNGLYTHSQYSHYGKQLGS